jgi:polyhydroxyalkanoate synthesis regulator protein
MENFARNQEQIRSYMGETFGRFFPLNQFEEMARQNMALFQRAASLWRPFPIEGDGGEIGESTGEAAAGPAARRPRRSSIPDGLAASRTRRRGVPTSPARCATCRAGWSCSSASSTR